MSKQQVLRIGAIVIAVIFFLYTFPYLFRVYLIVIPAVGLYFLFSKFDFFSAKKGTSEQVYDITETEDWKTKWWNSLSTGIIPAFREFLWIVRKVALVSAGVILIVVVVLYFVVNSLKVSRTNDELADIANEIAVYKARNNKLPDNLEEVIARNPLKNSWKKDFWYKPIEYTKTSNGFSFLLRSAGKDGVLNTEDDLVVKSN